MGVLADTPVSVVSHDHTYVSIASISHFHFQTYSTMISSLPLTFFFLSVNTTFTCCTVLMQQFLTLLVDLHMAFQSALMIVMNPDNHNSNIPPRSTTNSPGWGERIFDTTSGA